MAVRPVLKMGHPLLYRQAGEVPDPTDPALKALVEDLWDTMAALDGAGLAAPQIGVSLRVVVFGVEANPRYPGAAPVPRTVLINPRIQVLGGETETAWEGCLSVPGLRGRVTRPARVRYRGLTPAGETLERTVEGFHARVVQHECDHLDGILFPMRLADARDLVYEEVLAAREAGTL